MLSTLGLSAISGAVSGATHNATKDSGLKRVGGTLKMTKDQMKEMKELANMMHKCKCVKPIFVDKLNKDLKKQSSSFIRTLLTCLAGSFLPSLPGKGLDRAKINKKKTN